MQRRPFRFAGGLFSAPTGKAWAEGARRLEGQGYDALLIADHFARDTFAPIPALVAAALATTTLRVGCTVFDNDFRHPAAAEGIAAAGSRPVAQILTSPYHLIGTVSEIVDTLIEQRARYGISYYSIFPNDAEAFAPVVARLAAR